MKRIALAWLGVCWVAGVAAAERHQVVGASFDSVAGWEVQDAPDHSTLIAKRDNKFAIFVVYTPHASVAGGLAAAFAPDWKASTTNTPTKTVPKPTARKLGTRNALEGSTDISSDGQAVFVDVLLLEVGTQVVPTLIYTQDRAMLKVFQADIDKMLASIQVAPPAETAPSAPPTVAPVTAAPRAPQTGARTLPTVTLADIAGSWSTHDQIVSTYVDSSTGAYSSTSATSAQDFYDIKPDGSYSHRFQGFANGHVIRESSKGTVSLTADAIVFTENGREVKRVHFIEFAIDADGNAHWKLLDAQYPTDPPNIGLYAEKWLRAAPKK